MSYKKKVRDRRKQRAIELLQSGISHRGVCRMLNISEYTLAQYIRESGISGTSSSESRRQRDERVKYVAEQVAAGRNKQELADDLGLCLSTIYAYLQQLGHVKRSARETNMDKALRLHGQGKSPQEIAQVMNLSVATIRSYIFKRRKMKKKKCDKCGRREKLERWRGKNLCPSCLNPDTDIDISYAAHWAEYQRSLEMAYY